jgi:2-polyprenyl-6-methoxyphenol hydroxylase-like FAD-dependent oxidoreductase
MKCIIIGGGIAGLTTAVALRQKGVEAEVYEAASALKPVGAGIAIGKNASQVFQKLGLEEKLKSPSIPVQSTVVTNNQAVPLQEPTATNVVSFCIHRAILHDILHNACAPNSVHLNKRLASFEENENGVMATFQDGTTAKGDILIGADGINSVVRKHIAPQIQKRYSSQTCWRGVCEFDLSPTFKNNLTEMWGGRGRFGLTRIDEKRMYWFAVESKVAENGKDDQTQIHQKLTALFKDFHPEINEIIKATPQTAIHRGDLHDLEKVNYPWHTNKVCLIGDAAHATTPNMGQGAGQGIEDGYAIALALSKHTAPLAFERFQKVRQAKVRSIVDTSWMIGKVAHWENSVATSLRDFMFKLTPSSVMEKQLTSVLDISYIEDI